MPNEIALQAPVFNIVRGSSADGWGLRTAILLKGCPLRCRWCCSPEGQKKYLELKYTAEDCTGCGRCVDTCPRGAITMSGGEKSVAAIDRSMCGNCLACVDVCDDGALDVFGKTYTVDGLMEEIERDRSRFGEDGGVTIGGGEATLYPEFTLELIRKCQAAHIHTALDTCGHITTDAGLRCLAETDLALYDIKGLDREAHIRGTGVSNEIILKNLEYRDNLDDPGKEIIVRLPLIPGYNDSEENLQKTAELLKGLKTLKRVDILPFNKNSKIKYRQLGWSLPNVFEEILPLEREEAVLKLFLGYGLPAQIGG